ECYQKVIEVDPDDAGVYYNMGIDYHYKGNYDKAMECYKKAARLGHRAAQDYLRKNWISW
ncbi:MAG: tetratricopeptide repeat protein, partial [Candidatus Cloacimonetes bacterium]|nr:tetratricopeptide repeat protein [Candidatus Cloacimonadota bacterium]